MNLKENLNRLMKEQYLTIKALAQKTGISEPTLKRLKTKDCNPTLEVLIKLANAFGTDIHQLIEDKTTLPILHNTDPIEPDGIADEFIILFSKQMFSFQTGTKAIFKKYCPGDPITKYIIDTSSRLLETVDKEKLLFQSNESKIFSINEKDVLAFIVKELYEVYYV